MLEIVVAPSFACCYFQSTSTTLRSRIPFNGIKNIIIARLVNCRADASIGRPTIQLSRIKDFIRLGCIEVDARLLSQCTIGSDSYCGIILRTIYVQILLMMTTACSAKEEFEILKSQKFSCRDRVLAFLLGHFC